MLRNIICTATLIVIAAAAQVDAGGFKVNFGGGNHRNNNHNSHHNNNYNKYQQNTYHYGYQQQHVQPYHAPVQYYQVCYHCDAWGYHKYQSFTCPIQAAAYVAELQGAGYYAVVAPTYQPYANGHIIYKQQQYNHWMP